MFSKKYHKALYILLGLMGLGLLVELIVNINIHVFNLKNENYIYNLYIPLEYLFYASFFYYINTNKLIKKVIKLTIPLFIISVLLILKNNPVAEGKFLSNVYILGGILTVSLSFWSLFILKPIKHLKFNKHPLFWFCTAFIVFYTCILPFSIFQFDLERKNIELFIKASHFLRKGANIIFYILLLIGFIFSDKLVRWKK